MSVMSLVERRKNLNKQVGCSFCPCLGELEKPNWSHLRPFILLEKGLTIWKGRWEILSGSGNISESVLHCLGIMYLQYRSWGKHQVGILGLLLDSNLLEDWVELYIEASDGREVRLLGSLTGGIWSRQLYQSEGTPDKLALRIGNTPTTGLRIQIKKHLWEAKLQNQQSLGLWFPGLPADGNG